LSGGISDIHTTRMRDVETHKQRAPNVQVRAVLADGARAAFRWLDDVDTMTIEPGGRLYFRLCEVFANVVGYTSRSHHPEIEPGQRVEIEMQIVIGGRVSKHSQRFVVDWSRGPPWEQRTPGGVCAPMTRLRGCRRYLRPVEGERESSEHAEVGVKLYAFHAAHTE
jgi:hypothetical protein